jgi:hypothetical protein
MFVYVGLGEFAFDFYQNRIGCIDNQQVNFYSFVISAGRGPRVKLVDGNAPVLKELDYSRAHLPLDKFPEAVTEFAELLVELLVLLSEYPFSLLESPLSFLRHALGFFLGCGEFAD